MQVLDINEIDWENSISVDSLGRVFFKNDKCFRAIRTIKQNRITRMIQSGMMNELIDKKFILPVKIADIELSDPQYGMVLETKRIRNVINPTQWSCIMMIDAAIHMLNMYRVLKKYNYTFYDYHPYNMIFDKNMELYHIDLGSLIYAGISSESDFITAIEEKYYRPLVFWHITGESTSMLWLWDNGVNDTVWKIICNGVSDVNVENEKAQSLDDLEKKLLELKQQCINCAHSKINIVSDEKGQWDEKRKVVEGIVEKYNITAMTELSTDSRSMVEECTKSKSIEYGLVLHPNDKYIDYLYTRVIEQDCNINLGVLNVMAPIDCDGYRCFRKMKNEAVLIIEYLPLLCLPHRASLETALYILGQFTQKWIIIEFNPLGYKGDNGLLLPYWWTAEKFKEILQKQYDILEVIYVNENSVFYVGRRKICEQKGE